MGLSAANSIEKWDALWKEEGRSSWRGEVLHPVYERIRHLMPAESRVVDLGGGAGILASLLNEAGHDVEVWEHSPEALKLALDAGVKAWPVNLLEPLEALSRDGSEFDGSVVVATEVLEHLSDEVCDRWVEWASKRGRAFFSVPNDRLGPDEEAQHFRKWTALSFKRYLERYFTDVRVEVLGSPASLPPKQYPSDRGQPQFLLGVCGFPKGFKLSFTMPVRDEAVDIERVLASFRGVADQIVIGVDPRTVDDTRVIAEKYAEVVFDLTDLRGPPEEQVPEGGIHFAHARNQGIDRCTGDWIFMSEGHEHLGEGQDILLSLGRIMPDAAKIGFVLRTMQDQQWGFPWLFRNDPQIRFKRPTHNVLSFPDGAYVVQLPGVKTVHDRVHERETARREQRKVQNRLTLLHDWSVNRNQNSLYYLGSEWREFSDEKAIDYLQEYLATKRSNGSMRYHTRLMLGKLLARHERMDEAREILLGCAGDDWVRTDHWVWLGDLAFERGRFDEALQFYLYGASRVGDPPFTIWWIEMSFYTYIPCQRLAMVYSRIGKYDLALVWAERVLEQMPKDLPKEMVEEATQNRDILREHVTGVGPDEVPGEPEMEPTPMGDSYTKEFAQGPPVGDGWLDRGGVAP